MVHLKLLSSDLSGVINIRKHNRLNNVRVVIPYVKIHNVDHTNFGQLIVGFPRFKLIFTHPPSVEKATFIHEVLINLHFNVEKPTGLRFYSHV